MVNAQEWLDKEYPAEKRNAITELNIEEKDLEGLLKIDGFKNLKMLDCSFNKLTTLTIKNCPKISVINCQNNSLTDFDFSSLNPEILSSITVYNNNISTRDLSCFSYFINLEKLWLGSNYHVYYPGQQTNLDKNLYNHFVGSLEPLKGLTKLRTLGIPATDIDSGLEYLPDSLEHFNCDSHINSRKVITIERNLAAYYDKEGKVSRDGLKKWRTANASLIQKARRVNELEKQYRQLQDNQTLFVKQDWEINYLEKRVQELTYLIKQQKEKIISILFGFCLKKEKKQNWSKD